MPARKTPLVARGQFVGYLTSRETAARLGLPRSGGCLRAEAWNRFPIIRMINVSLEPDPRGPSLEELIADTDDGVLMGNNKSWSIDDLRLNFQFGCEIAWEIKRGKRTRILQEPALRRHDAALLERLRRRRRARGVSHVGPAVVRQGRSDAAHGGRARLPAGALPRHQGRERMSVDGDELIESIDWFAASASAARPSCRCMRRPAARRASPDRG